jgi:hypothetical protein
MILSSHIFILIIFTPSFYVNCNLFAISYTVSAYSQTMNVSCLIFISYELIAGFILLIYELDFLIISMLPNHLICMKILSYCYYQIFSSVLYLILMNYSIINCYFYLSFQLFNAVTLLFFIFIEVA